MEKFETKQNAAECLIKLEEFLEDNKLIINNTDWANKLGVHKSVISRVKTFYPIPPKETPEEEKERKQKERLPEAQKVFEDTLATFNLEVNYNPLSNKNQYSFTKIKYFNAEMNNVNNSISPIKAPLNRFAGFYKAYFVRSVRDQLSELAFCIMPNGRSFYYSVDNNGYEETNFFEGVFTYDRARQILWGDFTSSTYKVQIILESVLHDVADKKCLEGLYIATAQVLLNIPFSGAIRFYRRDFEELGSNFTEEQAKQKLETFSKELKSYKLNNEKELDAFIFQHPTAYSFLLGKFNSKIATTSLSFWQKHRIVPRFNFENVSQFEGKYLLYRLNSQRDRFLARQLLVFNDGRVKFIVDRYNRNNARVYWGRLSFFDNFCLAITIDRRIEGLEEFQHGGQYLFNAKADGNFNYCFGKACFTDSNNRIAISYEILERIKDDKDWHSLDLAVENLGSLSNKQKNFFTYLSQNPILSGLKEPDSQKFESNRNLGQILFGNACYLSRIGNKRAGLEMLEEAISFGFDDTESLKLELSDNLKLVSGYVKIRNNKIIIENYQNLY